MFELFLFVIFLILVAMLASAASSSRPNSKRDVLTVPTEIKRDIFNKNINVRVFGPKQTGKKSLIEAYKTVNGTNRFYFPSEKINFLDINSMKNNIDVIWFVINYHGRTKHEDFDILRQQFSQIPVIVVLNKVDVLQEFSGDTFDLIDTAELPVHLAKSPQLAKTRERYQLLKKTGGFSLSQVIMTSMREEESFDRPVGLLGLYQATLNCMDDKQFARFDQANVSDKVRDFLGTIKTIKSYKKNSWRTVLIYGASNNGKSNLINNILGENVAKIGQDGTPTTMGLQLFKDETSKILYVDSAGLEKHDNTDKIIQLASFRPDLIWLVLNYTSSIEPVELDISTTHFPNTPRVIILNKVDILQELNTITEDELNNFDRCIPNALKSIESLISKRRRLISQENLHRLLLMSLRKDEDDDRTIGMKNLLNVTRKYFENLTSDVGKFKPDLLCTNTLTQRNTQKN